MAKSNLVRVRDKDDNILEVHPDWLTRWPDDFELVEDTDTSNDSEPSSTDLDSTPKPRSGKQKENADA